MQNVGTSREMPRYQCHKKVWALKIKEIVFNEPKKQELPNGGSISECGRSATITPEEKGYAPFNVNEDYIAKHNPKVGGYFVIYDDAYQSFSPADAFESGYSLIK